jgi:hypothetical protein
VKHEARAGWRHALSAASALVILAASHQAYGECVSPSAQAGATVTTVYRCPDVDPAQAKQPALRNTEKTTVVERGSADLPWFEPQTAGNKVDAAKPPAAKIIEPAKIPAPMTGPAGAPDKPVETVNKPVETVKLPIEPTGAPDKPVETVKVPKKIETASAPEPEETAKVKKKGTAKKKFAGRKRVKKARIATTKAPKVKVAKKTSDVKTAEETPKIESKPADEKTIVWTKKDMPLGSRIKTWLGF